MNKKGMMGRAVTDVELLSVGEFSPVALLEKHSVLPLGMKKIALITEGLLELMFPCCFSEKVNKKLGRMRKLKKIRSLLTEEINAAFLCQSAIDGLKLQADSAAEISAKLLSSLAEIRRCLLRDAESIYKGDPAASSVFEVIISYPGFYATAVYRIANRLYLMSVPLIPRMMTELAHRMTGIDIHPGALIGESFFIDHGTGIVIGQTAEIGNRVKLYHGVTLGAHSFETDGFGNPIKSGKRHPTIGDDCTIYAGATILGGDTRIGDGSIIGSNVRLTKSLPPKSTIYYKGENPT